MFIIFRFFVDCFFDFSKEVMSKMVKVRLWYGVFVGVYVIDDL